MKAYVLHAVNDLRYERVPEPACPKGWALVKVMAAGICSSDIARVFTKGTYHFPTIPGHEFSGIVERVGDESDNGLIGKHVGIFPLIPCKKCSQCAAKHYEMCENYDYVGSRRDGGFAELVAVPVWNLLEVDASIPFTHVALLEPLSVALHAMKIACVMPGKSVCIVGTGMIGISAALWAKKMGATKVVVVGRSDSKRDLVERCGVEYLVNEKTEGCIYDIVLEAVGTPESVEQSILLAAPGGKIVFMGNPSGDIPLKQNTYWKLLRKQLNVSGTWNSLYDGLNVSDWTESRNAILNHEINADFLISHIFSQNQLVDGLELMKNGSEPYCKVMVEWNK